MYNPNSDF
jgi:hypothetical protein